MMLGSTVLDVAVGLALIYLLLSLICTAVNEMIASWFGLRAKTLEAALGNLLGQSEFAMRVQDHPLIKALHGETRGPSYIPPRVFSAAVLDCLAADAGASGQGFAAQAKATIEKIADPDIKKAFTSLLDSATGDAAKVRVNVEEWFNHVMDRASGWYKRQMQMITFLVGLTLVVALNADTVALSRRFYRDPTLRESFVAISASVAKQTTVGSATAMLESVQAGISEQVKFPLGDWSGVPTTIASWSWLRILLGWMITAVTITLGAPFWFDILGKLIPLRGAGTRPEVKPAEQTGKTK